MKQNELIKCKCGCGKDIWKYDSVWRERKYLQGHWLKKNQISFKKYNPQELIKCKCGCKEIFLRYDSWGNERRYIFGHQGTKRRIPKPIRIKSKEKVKCKCGCGKLLKKYDKWGERRRYILGHHQKKNRKNKLIRCKCGCKKKLWKYDRRGIKRSFINGHSSYDRGTSFEPYGTNWTSTYKENIKKRDKYKCLITKKTKDLVVHHIDYHKKNTNPKNNITVTRGQNAKMNGSKENKIRWKKECERIMTNIYGYEY